VASKPTSENNDHTLPVLKTYRATSVALYAVKKYLIKEGVFMRVVNHEQFVELPLGTVYSIFYKGTEYPIEIKDANIPATSPGAKDEWWCRNIFPDTESLKHDELIQSAEAVKPKFKKKTRFTRLWFWEDFNMPVFIIYDRGDIIEIANKLLASKEITPHHAKDDFNILGEFKYVNSYVRLMSSFDETEFIVEYNYPDGTPGKDSFKSLSHAKSFYETAVAERLYGHSYTDVSIFMQQTTGV
jgi:hypothetical protein